MRRTNNGILIPDVPIMAGGNLPNAVKGVSAGMINPSNIPFYVRVINTVDMEAVDGLEISDDNKSWFPTTTRVLTAGVYYFRNAYDSMVAIAPNFGYDASDPNRFDRTKIYHIGGNIKSLCLRDFANEDVSNLSGFNSLFDGFSEGKRGYASWWFNLIDASQLILPEGRDFYGHNMFYRCNGLQKAPIMRMSELGDVSGMFWYTSVTYVVCLAETRVNTQGWLKNVPANGTFVKKKGISWAEGESGIPTGWTVEEID